LCGNKPYINNRHIAGFPDCRFALTVTELFYKR
jgi:hypothetical protein